MFNNFNYCSQSEVQVPEDFSGGVTACPACGTTMNVGPGSKTTVWPEFRTRWPSHSVPAVSEGAVLSTTKV